MLKVWEKGGGWGHQPQAEAWIVAYDTDTFRVRVIQLIPLALGKGIVSW